MKMKRKKFTWIFFCVAHQRNIFIICYLFNIFITCKCFILWMSRTFIQSLLLIPLQHYFPSNSEYSLLIFLSVSTRILLIISYMPYIMLSIRATRMSKVYTMGVLLVKETDVLLFSYYFHNNMVSYKGTITLFQTCLSCLSIGLFVIEDMNSVYPFCWDSP